MLGTDTSESALRLRAACYPPWARLATALLAALCGVSLLALAALFWLSDRPVNPLRLMRLVAALYLLPGLAVVAARSVFAADLRLESGQLVVAQRRRRLEIPVASIAAVEPWRLPLPGSGLRLRLRSGERWGEGIEMADPATLVDSLVAAGAASELGDAARHPSLVYARARARSRRWSWWRAVLKFPVFALVPTIPLFRVHQIIAYGGPFGEYHLYGLGAYLGGFAIYWATLTIYLMLFAAVLRVPVELLAMGSAVALPEHAVRIRGVLDRLAAVLFYAGVPAAVILRFMPW